jgi:hypothetical protein
LATPLACVLYAPRFCHYFGLACGVAQSIMTQAALKQGSDGSPISEDLWFVLESLRLVKMFVNDMTKAAAAGGPQALCARGSDVCTVNAAEDFGVGPSATGSAADARIRW